MALHTHPAPHPNAQHLPQSSVSGHAPAPPPPPHLPQPRTSPAPAPPTPLHRLPTPLPHLATLNHRAVADVVELTPFGSTDISDVSGMMIWNTIRFCTATSTMYTMPASTYMSRYVR